MHEIMPQTSIDSLRIMLRLQLLLVHADKLLAAARVLAKTIVGNAVKPRGEARFAPKAADIFVSANKAFLREIVGERDICPGELPQQTTHSGLMPAHELAERVLIIIDKDSGDKVRIG
jgi:hypothetical protein